MQNAAERILIGVGHRDHVTPVVAHLHWLLISFRAQFKLLMLTLEAICGTGTVYLNDCLMNLLQPSSKDLLQMPPSSKVAISKGAFLIVDLWNPFFRETHLTHSAGSW